MLNLGILDKGRNYLKAIISLSLLLTLYLWIIVPFYCINLEFCFLQRIKQVIHIRKSQAQCRVLDTNTRRLGDGEHT